MQSATGEVQGEVQEEDEGRLHGGSFMVSVLKRIGWRGRVKAKDFWKEKHEHRHGTGMA